MPSQSYIAVENENGSSKECQAPVYNDAINLDTVSIPIIGASYIRSERPFPIHVLQNFKCNSAELIQRSPSCYLHFRRLSLKHGTSFLHPGTRFCGFQNSGRFEYEVNVTIQNVDFDRSFLCGSLEIQGLTSEFPFITTYFEGEIIGPKYSFLTNHEEWGATEALDLQHWKKFSAFRKFFRTNLRLNAKHNSEIINGKIFMRWKEQKIIDKKTSNGSLLSPISCGNLCYDGISYAGYYYICLDLKTSKITGYYYHCNSEL